MPLESLEKECRKERASHEQGPQVSGIDGTRGLATSVSFSLEEGHPRREGKLSVNPFSSDQELQGLPRICFLANSGLYVFGNFHNIYQPPESSPAERAIYYLGMPLQAHLVKAYPIFINKIYALHNIKGPELIRSLKSPSVLIPQNH